MADHPNKRKSSMLDVSVAAPLANKSLSPSAFPAPNDRKPGSPSHIPCKTCHTLVYNNERYLAYHTSSHKTSEIVHYGNGTEHSTIERGANGFTCPCGYTTHRASRLREHVYLHKDKPATAQTNVQYTQSIIIHRPAPMGHPYICQYCETEQQYPDHETYSRHLSRCHDMTVGATFNDGYFRLFFRSLRDGCFACLCNLRLVDSDAFIDHAKIHSSSPPLLNIPGPSGPAITPTTNHPQFMPYPLDPSVPAAKRARIVSNSEPTTINGNNQLVAYEPRMKSAQIPEGWSIWVHPDDGSLWFHESATGRKQRHHPNARPLASPVTDTFNGQSVSASASPAPSDFNSLLHSQVKTITLATLQPHISHLQALEQRIVHTVDAQNVALSAIKANVVEQEAALKALVCTNSHLNSTFTEINVELSTAKSLCGTLERRLSQSITATTAVVKAQSEQLERTTMHSQALEQLQEEIAEHAEERSKLELKHSQLSNQLTALHECHQTLLLKDSEKEKKIAHLETLVSELKKPDAANKEKRVKGHKALKELLASVESFQKMF